MHSSVLIIAEPQENYPLYVQKVMEPYSEEESKNGWWDWYVIGGRWSGELTEIKLDQDKLKKIREEFEKQGLNWISMEKTNEIQKEKSHKLWREFFGNEWKDEEIPIYRDSYAENGFNDDIQPVSNFTPEQLKLLNTAHVIDKDGCYSYDSVWSGKTYLEDKEWNEKFYERFLADLKPTDMLIIVDCHD